jgi:hypothetical protein
MPCPPLLPPAVTAYLHELAIGPDVSAPVDLPALEAWIVVRLLQLIAGDVGADCATRRFISRAGHMIQARLADAPPEVCAYIEAGWPLDLDD